MKKSKRRRSATEIFVLPQELMPGVPRVTISGGYEVYVENHAGLISYSTECIEVRGRNAALRINGKDLQLATMTKANIITRGIIVSVELY